MERKLCTGCGVFKPLSEYHPHKKSPLGVASQCKACRSTEDAVRKIAKFTAIIEAAYDAGAKGEQTRDEYVRGVLYGKDS